jgi:chromosome segregation ATPase
LASSRRLLRIHQSSTNTRLVTATAPTIPPAIPPFCEAVNPDDEFEEAESVSVGDDPFVVVDDDDDGTKLELEVDVSVVCESVLEDISVPFTISSHRTQQTI